MDSLMVADDTQPNKRQRLSGTNDYVDSNRKIPISTLCVRYKNPSVILYEPYDVQEIKSVFGSYGEIESVVVRNHVGHPNRHYLVQFKREEDAQKALDAVKNSQKFVVNAADQLHQPKHPLQVPPEQDSESNILNALDGYEHCVQEIFKHLCISDLTNVAEVCVHFNQQAKITFALQHKHLKLCNRDFIERVALKHFGKDIRSLCIDASLFGMEADALRLIGQSCGPKLKQLELRRFGFYTDLRTLRPIFAGIEQLMLEKCSDSVNLFQLMADCTELKSLTLSFRGFDNQQSILNHTFPKLQELSADLEHYLYYIDNEVFESFVIRHPTLIKLSIECPLPWQALRTIGQHGRSLQELRLSEIRDRYRSNDPIPPIGYRAAVMDQLNSLKMFQLEKSNIHVLNAITAGEVPIENLEIGFSNDQNYDIAIRCISQLKRIHTLRLVTNVYVRRFTNENLIELAKNLPKLEELRLMERHLFRSPGYRYKSQLSTNGLQEILMYSNKLKLLELQSIDSIKIDIDDYNMMLSTVQKRKKKVPLVIEIHDEEYGDQVDVPAAVLAENQNILNIKVFKV